MAADFRSRLVAEQKLRLAAEGALTQLQESQNNLETAHAAAQAAAAAQLEKLLSELLIERRRLHTFSGEAAAREEGLRVEAATATFSLQLTAMLSARTPLPQPPAPQAHSGCVTVLFLAALALATTTTLADGDVPPNLSSSPDGDCGAQVGTRVLKHLERSVVQATY